MSDFSQPIRKRRVPKACTSCRRCKVKCDGKRPCTTCAASSSECVYFAAIKDPTTERFEQLEQQIHSLNKEITHLRRHVPHGDAAMGDRRSVENITARASLPLNPGSNNTSPANLYHSPVSQPMLHNIDQSSVSMNETRQPSCTWSGRGSTSFSIREENAPDMVTRNLVTFEAAYSFFRSFFMGCDRFVPIFDPVIDTFESVRARSSILFDAICTVGSRMESEPSMQTYQLLNKDLKNRISKVVVNQAEATLESVQSVLIFACYSEKGWLLTSIATRMAVQLDLPQAYDEAVRGLADHGLSSPHNHFAQTCGGNVETSRIQLRRARTWLGLVVLEHIFSLDSGKATGIEIEAGIRRCRVLVAHPSRTLLDLRLLSQVELNAIRANTFEKVSKPNGLSDTGLIGFIRDTNIDLGLWLEEWQQIVFQYEEASEERDILIVNLRIQRDWAEIMMCCKALQSTGVENIAVMSPDEQEIIMMVKKASERHLEKLLSTPKLYLATFRYTMDFVWAKCAFSVLLLLKLAVLLPDGSDLPKLLADAKLLLGELSSINTTRNIYFQILSLSVQKAEKALDLYMTGVTGNFGQGVQHRHGGSPSFSGPPEDELDFQTYVPKEFVFEWDFPSLTLCFVPTDLQDLFSEFMNM